MTEKETKIWAIAYLKGSINTLEQMNKITKRQAEDMIAALNLKIKIEANEYLMNKGE